MKRLLAVVALSTVFALGCAKPSGLASEPTTSPDVVAQPPAPAPAPSPEADEERAAAPRPSVLFLLRHAEKADDGTRDPPLLPAGSARAECLANTLRDVAVTHVFATDLRRTQLTVEPLARAQELTVETSAAADVEGLAAKLLALPPGSTAVVAGHSNTIPALVERLGAQLTHLGPKGYIPEDESDRLVELVLTEPAAPPQLVELRYCAPSVTE